MVALHNKRLTQKDIFRQVLWTDDDWNNKKEEFYQSFIDEGYSQSEALMKAQEAMMEYQNSVPSMSFRQQFMKRIAPKVEVVDNSFTEEEIEYLLFKLHGVNEPVGQDILAKLNRIKESQE